MESFLEFLEKRCQLLEKVSKHTKSLGEAQATRPTNKLKNNSSTFSHAAVIKGKCPLCQEEHALYLCKTFLSLPISKRIEQVKQGRNCLNCLRLGHIAINCKSRKCRKCGKSHNTLLHLDRSEDDEERDEKQKSQPANNDETREIVATHVATERPVQRILPTAIVMITGRDGQMHRCSTLLDSGSQSNFMTIDLCNKLGLHIVKTDIIVAGLNQSKTKVLETATATIESMHTEFKERLDFLVVPKITFKLPSKPLDLKRINIPTEVLLADPDFHKPKKMDLLIGVDLFWDLICYETREHPYLYKTKLGYVVSGRLFQKSHRSSNETCSLATNVEDVSRYLKRFWEMEELPLEHHLSPEEQACESHFLKTTKRDSNGRFIVSIKASINDLGKSKGRDA